MNTQPLPGFLHPMATNVELGIEYIERAFAGVHLENGVSIREADVLDGYGSRDECARAHALDACDDWRSIPNEVIARYSWSLSFMDQKGMRFNIPAYMRFSIRHYKELKSDSIDHTIYSLSGRDQRFYLFTPVQDAAVRRFLKFMAYNCVSYCDSRMAMRALKAWSVESIEQRRKKA